MSSLNAQMVPPQDCAASLISHIVEHMVTDPKPSGSKGQLAVASEPSTTVVFHSSNDTNESTEVIRNIVDVPQMDNFTTSSVLHYCKRKVLSPYQRFLMILGWRTVYSLSDVGLCTKVAAAIYTTFVILFTLFGYVLQFAACYRRDVITGYKVVHITQPNGTSKTQHACKGSSINNYLIPDVLHFCAYFYMFYLLRIKENEQLQVLTERVFLQAFYSRSNYMTQPKIFRLIKVYVIITLTWLMLSSMSQGIHFFAESPLFTWMDTKNRALEIALIVFLILSALWNDMIHITIVSIYGIQCQLLQKFIKGLCERVKEKSCLLEEAIKEISESAKILKYLNENFAVAVGLTMLYAGMMTVSGMIWIATVINSLNNIRFNDMTAVFYNLMSIIMWTTSFAFPIIQAARLTASCQSFEKLGLYLMTRPFGYQDAPLITLQPFLLYTMSLKMKAKLFRIPVKPWIMFAIAVFLLAIILILIRCDIIKISV